MECYFQLVVTIAVLRHLCDLFVYLCGRGSWLTQCSNQYVAMTHLSQSYVMADGQSASMSWCQDPWHAQDQIVVTVSCGLVDVGCPFWQKDRRVCLSVCLWLLVRTMLLQLWQGPHRNTTSSIVICLFIAAETFLLHYCPAVAISSCSTILTFSRHVTVYLRFLSSLTLTII
jgi:hypothetical protein